MICFGIKTDQERKIKGHVGPTKKKKIKQTTKEMKTKRKESVSEGENFKKKFLSSLLSQIYGNRTVGIRRDKHEKCSTRRGLHENTRNTRFHREFTYIFGKSKFLVFLRSTAFY